MKDMENDVNLHPAAQVLEEEWDYETVADREIMTDGGHDYRSEAMKAYLGGSMVSAVAAVKELIYDLPRAQEAARYSGDFMSVSDEIAAGTVFAIGA